MPFTDVPEVLATALGAASGAGALALAQKLIFRREERANLTASAFSKILDSAGEGLKSQTTLVPVLVERIAKLEAARDLDLGQIGLLREKADETSDRLAATQARLEMAVEESRTLHAYLDDLLGWWAEHRVWDEQVQEEIQRLGGHVDAPRPLPDRRRVPGRQQDQRRPNTYSHHAPDATPASGVTVP